ncbi:MAG: hypothetical protein KDA85_07295, partial [Planctomycetaceae bacterium]|nr:hypothetical protein [Planctomycetaceae bacterium]
VYVFSDNTAFGASYHAQGIAMSASHEVGHALGLNHHSVYDATGTKTQEYDPGNGTIGPIMGAPYNTTREVWANAPADTSSTIFQDDLAVLTRATNQTFQYRVDDYGSTVANAYQLDNQNPVVFQQGIIERTGDIDYFAFQAADGTVTFNANGLDVNTIFGTAGLIPGANLDITLALYDSAGNQIAVTSPGNSLNASLTHTVSTGQYYIAVSGSGLYGDLGQYTLDGTFLTVPAAPTLISPSGTLASVNPLFQWTFTLNADHYELEVANLTTGVSQFYVQQNLTGTQHTSVTQFPEGTYEARVRSVDSTGKASVWSNVLTFTVDIPAPAQPVITKPTGSIADPFPVFEWNQTPGAVSYSLWVNDFNTGKRVIYRTNETALKYQHFTALPDGTYRAWVRAFNSQGEYSLWSNFVEFEIDTPVPDAPVISAPTKVTTELTPRISWNAVPSTARYDLWVDYRSGGIPQYIRKQNIIGTQNYYDPTSTLPQGRYVAWVRAINANGEAGAWSPGYSFDVDLEVPTTPTITGPVGTNGSLTIPNADPIFTWTAADRAARYDLWVNNVTTGQVQIIRNQNITSTSFQSADFLPQGTYRVWVRAINAADEVGAWSKGYTFTIDEPTPSVPVITGPVANPAGTITDATPTFTWTTDLKLETYDLWIDDTTTGKFRVYRNTTITTETFTLPNANALVEHVYNVWVRAANSSGEYSAWSAPYAIRIDIPNPTTPTILSPSDTINDTTPTFQWSHDGSSTRYEILVRDLNRAENIVLQVTSFNLSPNGSIASYTLPDAQAFLSGTYRFWIRAFNSVGQVSSWSASRTFVIAAASPVLPADVTVATRLTAPAAVAPRAAVVEVPEETSTPMNSVPGPAAEPVLVDGAKESSASSSIAAELLESDQSAVEHIMAELADPTVAGALTLSESSESDEIAASALALPLAAAMLPVAVVPGRDLRRKTSRR